MQASRWKKINQIVFLFQERNRELKQSSKRLLKKNELVKKEYQGKTSADEITSLIIIAYAFDDDNGVIINSWIIIL
jgi:hypothetical protein